MAPILQQKCQECHSQGGIAPFSHVTYSDTKDLAELVVEKTKSREMPPWGALDTDECMPRLPWKDDLRLSDAELATLEAWRKAGAPEGDAKAAPPPRISAGGKLAGARELVKNVSLAHDSKSDDNGSSTPDGGCSMRTWTRSGWATSMNNFQWSYRSAN